MQRDNENAHEKRREKKHTQLVIMPSSSKEAAYIHQRPYYQLKQVV